MLSFFINNLSYSIIDNIILFSILWLVYDLLKMLFHLSAQNKFLLSKSFLSIGAFYFWFDFFSDKQYHLIQFFSASSIFQGLDLSITSITSAVYFSIVNSIVALVYIVTLFILVGKFTVQYTSLRSLKNNSDFSNNNYFELLKGLGGFEIKEIVKIGLHHQISSPLVFGILEHIVLLPVALCNQISQQELKMLLLHEYAHIIRKDFLLNLLVESAGILLWFNPFVYLFKKELNLQREIACDEYVVKNTSNPISYSKALLSVAENSKAINQQLSLAAYSNNTDLKTRIELINGIHKNTNQITNKETNIKITLMAGFILIATFLFINVFNTTIVNHVNFDEVKLASSNAIVIHKLPAAKTILTHSTKSNKLVSKMSIANNESNNVNKPEIEKELAYSDLVSQTKNWIKAPEDPLLFTGYNENTSFNTKDSTEEVLANKLLILSIVKKYQLKKAIFEEKVKNIAKNASNKNEAMDYLLNSTEWNEMVQYEKWVQEFLQRQ